MNLAPADACLYSAELGVLAYEEHGAYQQAMTRPAERIVTVSGLG